MNPNYSDTDMVPVLVVLPIHEENLEPGDVTDMPRIRAERLERMGVVSTDV